MMAMAAYISALYNNFLGDKLEENMPYLVPVDSWEPSQCQCACVIHKNNKAG